MHPDDELRKRLRERFASYEPESETSWQELETRLVISPKPVRRKGRVVAVILLSMLVIGGAGFWISRQSGLWSAQPASMAKGTISKPYSAGTDKSPRDVKKQLQTNNQSLSGTIPSTRPVLTDSEEIKSSRRTPHLIAQLTKGTNLPLPENRTHSRKARSNPFLIDRPSSRNTGSISSLVNSEEKNLISPERYPEKNEASLSGEPSSLSNDLSEYKIATMRMLKARQIAHLFIRIPPPHLPIQPTSKELSTNKPARLQPAWVVKAGALLSYSGMNSIIREGNSALGLENLRASLPERLGWHLYIGQQRPLSHGRQLEIGAVLRQFGQGIRYQVPNGAYSVAVQPDHSATVTQLRDTLSDQFMIRQAGLRLGYRAPVLLTAGLYGSVSGEAVYQFNLRRVVMNAEVAVGKTLTHAGSKAIMVELFANTAIRSVYDSHGWVRVLPYHVGLRIGVPLGASR